LKVGIVGLGLIGGSLALALRDRHEVAGYDRSPATRGAAAAAGLAVVSRLEDVVGDVVIVATPLSEIVPVVQQLAPHADGCVVLDTGSLKGVIAEYAQHAPDRLRLVGGHPMAGATAAGFASADPDLFRGRAFLLVPTARSDDRSMGVAGDVARECGAVVTVCSAEVHDRAMARLIVAPLAAAAALAAGATDAAPLLSSAGPGFRDSTRLAETPLELALELLFGEPERSNAAIESVVEGLRQLRDRLAQGDRDYVRSFLLAAQAVRREMAAEPEASARLHGEA
jgi:prephenate dehydrogenase